jgi:hypothetical protein
VITVNRLVGRLTLLLALATPVILAIASVASAATWTD